MAQRRTNTNTRRYNVPRKTAYLEGSAARQLQEGYDVRKVLTEKELYFLRSLPSIYLLGEDKQVLLKESSSIGEVTSYLLNKYDDI